ncbi:hypothetical protein COU88_00815 [Candidatus Roizmanbacteria bacterium CG10_big_fil_rev_8_21_14_0_10_39_6]|uniref:Uncharacterized protein n=1 Tax=Candidatus Roizmanbacteria bacterium CG10_big_fil_rev_8_21_14_0_10_39_6 TaxID=1974853 RepID=A0A2M8KTJ3_9BACT|nr:MAG: hypothetical protein COU88_00815 [Candidatus Roizmanbacteria bacterium CG10_big_fil_rev_8_21_14_0_10_39_6]
MQPDKEKTGIFGFAKLIAQALIGVPLTTDQKAVLKQRRTDEKLKTWYAVGSEIGYHAVGSAVKDEVEANGGAQLVLGAIHGVETRLADENTRKEIVQAVTPHIQPVVAKALSDVRDQIAKHSQDLIGDLSRTVDPRQNAATITGISDLRNKIVSNEDGFFTRVLKGAGAVAIKATGEGIAWIGAFLNTQTQTHADDKAKTTFQTERYTDYRNIIFAGVRKLFGLSSSTLTDVEIEAQKNSKKALATNLFPPAWVADTPTPTPVTP